MKLLQHSQAGRSSEQASSSFCFWHKLLRAIIALSHTHTLYLPLSLCLSLPLSLLKGNQANTMEVGGVFKSAGQPARARLHSRVFADKKGAA